MVKLAIVIYAYDSFKNAFIYDHVHGVTLYFCSGLSFQGNWSNGIKVRCDFA